MMKKTLLSVSIAGALALAATLPAGAEDDIECDGILVQSRFALANCMLESAVAIAATVVTDQKGCNAGEWDIAAVVPEWVLATIPVQGYLTLSGNGDELTLTGQASAMLQNDVSCRVATTDDTNTFAGRAVNYASGSGNSYLDAIVDKDESLLCIKSFSSAGNIDLEGSKLAYTEADSLLFAEDEEGIKAEGSLTISSRKGKKVTVLSGWSLEEEVLIPPVGETALEGFELEAYSDDLGEAVCEVKIEADLENLVYPTSEIIGGLTISGKLTIEAEDD
jgi:hypothetical protein